MSYGFALTTQFYKNFLEYNNIEGKEISKIGKLKVGFISDFLVLDSSVLRDRMGIIKTLSRNWKKTPIKKATFNSWLSSFGWW